MSQLSKLEIDLNRLEHQIYHVNQEYEILSKLFLKTEDVVRNIILSKNPTMKLKDATMMVYGTASNLSGIYPIRKDHELYNQANKMIESLKAAGMKLMKESIGIAEDLITTSIKIANSVAAMVQLIAPITFNLPAALSLLLLIIDAINQLIKRVTELINLLNPLKDLIYVIDITSMISSTAISSAVNTLTNAASTAAGNVSGAGSLLKGVVSDASHAAVAAGAAAAGNALSNLQLPNIPIIGTPDFNKYFDLIVLPIDIAVVTLIGFLEIISGFEAIIDWLLKQLKSAQKNASPTQSGVSAIFPGSIDELKDQKSVNIYVGLLNNLQGVNQSTNSITSTPITITFSSTSYVYDVLLPDGTVLNNLDGNQLEAIKEKYNVIFEDNNP